MPGERPHRRTACEHRLDVVLRRAQTLVLAREQRHVEVNPPLGAPPAVAGERSAIEVGEMAQRPSLPFDHLMEVGRVGERPSRASIEAASAASAGRSTCSAELSWTRPIRMPAARRRSSAAAGSSYSTREVAAVEAEPGRAREDARAPRPAEAKTPRELPGRQRADSHRSKNAIVSPWSRAGSRAPARCPGGATVRSAVELRPARSATRTTLRVICSQSSSAGAGHPRLVGQRRRRDAAVQSVRHQRGQDPDQIAACSRRARRRASRARRRSP